MNLKHGHARGGIVSPTYQSWVSMIQRCNNPRYPYRETYSERGITVCDRWLKFENFLADMGERPKGKTLDRKDNSKGYEPENCRWATKKDQTVNRRTTRWFTFNGETACLKDWCRRFGITPQAVDWRLKNGWSVEAAFTTPAKRGQVS